jgi:hypothetical protein
MISDFFKDDDFFLLKGEKFQPYGVIPRSVLKALHFLKATPYFEPQPHAILIS